MKILERMPSQASVMSAAFACRQADSFQEKGYFIRGDVFMRLRDGKSKELQEEREHRNLVVLDASILIARLMKDSAEPPHGLFALAVGTGNSGWDLQNPPAATNTQRALYSEITRKTFATTQFIGEGGVPVAYPTKVVDFTTIFTESEAVGPLVEMGLIGGNVSSNLSVRNPVSPANGSYNTTTDLTNFETLANYLTFLVVNKPATSTLEIVWRLTF